MDQEQIKILNILKKNNDYRTISSDDKKFSQ